jgi:uncharacterized membrane protein
LAWHNFKETDTFSNYLNFISKTAAISCHFINTGQLKQEKRSKWAAGLAGIGFMAAIDEIVFHQLLAWHHFYDRATPELALLSDGLLHSFELVALISGFFMLLDLNRKQSLVKARAWAGFFFGLGGFQLFDGIVDHKILRLHQVRYVENLLPYDIAWNLFGVILLIIGYIINRRAKSVENQQLKTKSAVP